MNKCKNCNKDTKNKYFCSHKCQGKYYKLKKFYCEQCGNFFQPNISIQKYCSRQCQHDSMKIKREKRKCVCGKEFNVRYTSTQEYCSYQCAMDNFEILNKKRKGTLKIKYNNENYNNIEKIQQTNLKKYGVENPFQLEEIKEKIKQTMNKKYGSQYYLNSNDFFKKIDKNKIQQKIKKINKTKFLNKLFDSNRLNGIIPLFSKKEYSGVNNNYKFQCNVCKTIFYDTLDNGKIPRCLKCYPIKYQKSQNEILDYVKSIYDGKILTNIRTIISSQELDIYIPDKKIAIEYNGLYWHSELILDKNYHLNKTKLCETQRIQLIHIFEDEWLNKQEIVKNMLKHRLGLSQEKVYARNCAIRELLPKEKNVFLDQYHIQGSDKSSIKLGLFYDRELVAVMTFSGRRLALGKKKTEKGEYELLRYATSHLVVGGASKLLSYFIKTYQPIKIISYADRRYSNGNLYDKLGFDFAGETQPNYWYFKNGYIERKHRFNFRKNVLNEKLKNFDGTLTEWENMQLNNYNRIWDCGNIRYEYDATIS